MTLQQNDSHTFSVTTDGPLLKASDYLARIEQSDFYQEGLHALRNNPRASNRHYNDSIAELKGTVAQQLLDERVARHVPKELDDYALEVITHVRPFLLSNLRLDSLKRRHDDDSYHEKRQAVQQLARFNRSVKEMVEHYPHIKMSETLEFISDLNSQINEEDHRTYFEHEVKEALVGIAHELYTRQMLDLLPGVEYREGGIQDDMHGADLFVSIDNSDFVPIDIKASEHTAIKKRQKAIIHGHDPNSIIDSKIPPEEVGDTFQISNKVAERHKDELKEAIELAVSSYYARK